MFCVSVDIGGTYLKGGIVDSTGALLYSDSIPSPSSGSVVSIFHAVASFTRLLVEKVGDHRLLKGISYGVPGIVSQEGVVSRSPHFPSWIDYPIQSNLQKEFDSSVITENDANLAALGEMWVGSAKSQKNFIFLTLGTGIGAGIVINGSLLKGDSGFAGEVGHIVIDKNGYFCPCGGRGCWELFASGSAISRQIHNRIASGDLSDKWKKRLEEFSRITPQDLKAFSDDGDEVSKAVYREFGSALGIGIASLVNVLGIETVIIGGGLVGAWDHFIGSTNQAIRSHIYSTVADRIVLKRALLGEKAGMIGGASLFFQKK